MAKKAPIKVTSTKSNKPAKPAGRTAATANPTLHGLLISRSFSGTVVRGLLFTILVFAFVLVGAGSTQGFSGLNALATWLTMTAIYLVFDALYVLMTYVRPLQPRLDRVVLPLGLVFSLAVIFAPVMFATDMAINLVGLWFSGAVGLLCVLGVRFALLIASSNGR